MLFDLWFPGTDSIALRSVMCRRCGFMTYAPRPAAADIEAKYRFLQESEKDIGGEGETPKAQVNDHQRAGRIFKTVMRHFAAGRIRLLDYGGGNGKLLAPFMEHGHSCVLIDYNRNPLPGIEKIGDSISDLPAGRKFDAILCSHVLEHVALPAWLLHGLSDHLAAGGVIYAEVPVECWRGIEIGLDPVTHSNFFNLGNFLELFARQGFTILEGRKIAGTYGESRMDVAFAVARKTAAVPAFIADRGIREAKRLMNPTFAMEVGLRLRMRRFPTMRGMLKRLRAAVTARPKE